MEHSIALDCDGHSLLTHFKAEGEVSLQRAQGYKDVGKGRGYVAKLICNGWGLQWMIFGSRSWWRGDIRRQEELQRLWTQGVVGQALTQKSISVEERAQFEFLNIIRISRSGDFGKVGRTSKFFEDCLRSRSFNARASIATGGVGREFSQN